MPSPAPPIAEIVHTFTGNLTGDGDAGIRVAGFLPHAHPLRRSVTDYYTTTSGYYNAFPNASTSQIASSSSSPPSYGDIQDGSLPPSRFKILPREEEGKEKLPAYSCSIHKEGVFLRKMELSSPFDRASVRKWKKHYVVLHGTLLKVHKVKKAPLFGKIKDSNRGGEEGFEKPVGYFPGSLVKSYTLQGAEVGIAGDYKKRHFVIRIRVETDQFLISARKIEDFMGWLEALSAAVDLSPSLEERSLPRYQTIPRRRRRGGAQVVREQERIIRREFPHLVEGDAGGSEPTNNTNGRDTSSRIPASSSSSSEPSPDIGPRISLQESITEADLRDLRLELAPPASSPSPQNTSSLPANTSTRPPSSARTDNHPSAFLLTPSAHSFTPSGKWSPPPVLTAEANLRYARRCMAVLCGDAPRQSDFIVKDGKRYQLLYETKTMVLDEVRSGIVTRTALEMGMKRAVEEMGAGIGVGKDTNLNLTLDDGQSCDMRLPRYTDLYKSPGEGGRAMDEGVDGLGIGVAM